MSLRKRLFGRKPGAPPKPDVPKSMYTSERANREFIHRLRGEAEARLKMKAAHRRALKRRKANKAARQARKRNRTKGW
jgi:hypothetical protein